MFPIDSLHGACHIKRGSGGWAEDLRTRGHMHKPSMRKVEQISALSTLDDTCIKISLEYYALHLCVALRCQGCLRACLFALILTAGSTICLLGVFTSVILMLFSGAAWGNISIASLYEQKNSHKNDIYGQMWAQNCRVWAENWCKTCASTRLYVANFRVMTCIR